VSKPVLLVYPTPLQGIGQWLVYGLDPSMSRTGYALMRVTLPEDPLKCMPCQHPGCLSHASHPCEGCGSLGGLYPTQAEWVEVGSVKAERASDPIWIRGKGMALHLKEVLVSRGPGLHRQMGLPDGLPEPTGLLISMEFPTPMNDFLVALNRIIHLVFFENSQVTDRFKTARVLATNAATLRSVMGLSRTGRKNKAENILRAYDFIDKSRFPRLDPDSCDAVLLAMMGRYTASILLDRGREVPGRALHALCSGQQKAKGKGSHIHIVTQGILHRPEYFYEYAPREYAFCMRDASSLKVGLERKSYLI